MQICQLCGSVFADDGIDITPTLFPALRDLGRVLDDAQHRATHKDAKGQTQERAESLSLALFWQVPRETFRPWCVRSCVKRKRLFSVLLSLSLHIYSVPPYFFPRVEFAESSVLQRLFGIDESRSGKRRADLSSYLTHSASNCTPSSCRVRPSFRSFLGSYLLSHQLRSRIWDSGDFSNLSSFSF